MHAESNTRYRVYITGSYFREAITIDTCGPDITIESAFFALKCVLVWPINYVIIPLITSAGQ